MYLAAIPIHQPPKLNGQQMEALKKFITRFLPKTGNKRKNTGNELEYMETAISRVCNKNFGFKVSRTDLLTAFEELQYSIYTKNGDWDPDTKEYRPSDKGDTLRADEGYLNYGAMFIYIDVEATAVRSLRLLTAGISANAKDEKVKRKAELQKQVDQFKQTISELL